ncbi:MAG: hypothetical protein HY901_15970 [Deltaproteobacteria bacterium]|nr:hypothetical protein [Deltaproteobacteria bacterium]
MKNGPPRSSSALALALAGALLLSACPEASVDAPDASAEEAPDIGLAPDARTPFSPDPPVAPEPVQAPSLSPCPAGWRLLPGPTADSAAVCEPWPEAGVQECEPDSAHFPGEPGCSRIGADCPSGDWPEDLPDATKILYVRAGAAAGGTGTLSAPYRSIGAALSAATAGTVVAIGKGDYCEDVILRTRVTIWGACVAQTRVLAPSYSNSRGVVSVVGGPSTVRNLQVSGSRPGIWAEGSAVSLTLKDVVIEGAETAGLLARAGARVKGTNVVIRGTHPQTATQISGRGLSVEVGAQVDLSRVSIESSFDFGALVMDSGSALRLSAAAIRNTRSRASDGTCGRGLDVQSQGSAELNGVVLEGNHESGATVLLGGSLVLGNVVIRGTEPSQADVETGFGLTVLSGSTAEAQRCLFDRNHGFGLFIDNEGSRVDLSDVVIRDTRGAPAESQGTGLGIADRATGIASRVAFERNLSFGVLIQDPGTRLDLTDLTVLDTGVNPKDGDRGFGLEVGLGAHATLKRALLSGNHVVGLLVDAAGSQLEAQDLTIRDTLPSLDDQAGIGLSVQEGAQATAERVVLEGNRVTAVMVASPSTTATLTDVVARQTLSEKSTGQFGHGVHVQDSAQLSLQRVLLDGNREIGLQASGSSVTATDIAIVDTHPNACDGSGCPGLGWGAGVLSASKATLSLSRFLVTRSHAIGIELVLDGAVDLAHGEVSSNPIGVGALVSSYDMSRLQQDVVYCDNANDFSADFVPLPDLQITLP